MIGDNERKNTMAFLQGLSGMVLITDSQYSKFTSLAVLEKAAANGSKRAVGNDKDKAVFLAAVLANNKDSKKFYQDVLAVCRGVYQQKATIRGKCGQELCSDGYIEYFEKRKKTQICCIVYFPMETFHQSSFDRSPITEAYVHIGARSSPIVR